MRSEVNIFKDISFVGLNLILCVPAAAQETGTPDASTAIVSKASANDNPGVLDEIVVTAQRRAENLQDVPVMVSAATAEVAAARGIREITDLPILSPGLAVTFESIAPTLYLRGVGTTNSQAGNEQNVAIYIDGVYYPSLSADLGSFSNIERIEVLKGPQGTLFGRNTTGGLVQVITKDPAQDLGGNASIGYGNYRTVDGSLYLTGGLSSNLAADIAVTYRNQLDGWGRNLVNGSKAYFGKSYDIRSKWVLTPADGTKITLAGGHSYRNSNFGISFQVLNRTPLPPLFGSAVYPGNIYDSTGNEPGFSITKQDSASLRLDQELGSVKLMAISAYVKTVGRTHYDIDWTPSPFVSADFPSNTKSFSQEVQLSSNGEGRLKWIAGALYFYADAKQDPLAIYVGPANTLLASYDTGQKTYSPSVYGQATYALTDQTNFTAGARYTSDRKVLYGALTALVGSSYVVLPVDDTTRKRTFNSFTYKVALDHHFTPDVMAYASVSTGFKSGTYNLTIGAPNDQPVRPEKLTDYEVGIKSELFDRRLRFNIGGFYYDYKDIQTLSFTGTAIITINAARARVYGGEAELEALLTDNLRLSASAAVMDSEYRSFPNAPAFEVPNGIGVLIPGFDAAGNELARAPKFTGSVSLDYRVPLSFGELAANATLYHNSGFFWEYDNRLRQRAYDLLNLSLGWTSPDERLSVKVWGKNLNNAHYYTLQLSGLGAPDAGTAAAPRTYGAALGIKF